MGLFTKKAPPFIAEDYPLTEAELTTIEECVTNLKNKIDTTTERYLNYCHNRYKHLLKNIDVSYLKKCIGAGITNGYGVDISKENLIRLIKNYVNNIPVVETEVCIEDRRKQWVRHRQYSKYREKYYGK